MNRGLFPFSLHHGLRRHAAGFRLAVAWLVMMVTGPAAAQHQVRLPSGDIVEGSHIEIDETGHYRLTTPRGALSFPPGTPVVVAEPPEYRQAIERQRQGQHAEAIRLLRQVEEAYPNLQWDRRARLRLVESHLARNDDARAAEIFDQIAREAPEALRDPNRWRQYVDALQRSGREADLLALLSRTIRSDPRPLAARAQVMRGNLLLQRGEVAQAALDFLRTVKLFQDVPEIQPEALEKLAEVLRELDHPDAEAFNRPAANTP